MKKTLLLILMLFLFFAVAGPARAQQEYPTIIQDYPDLPACGNNPSTDCRPGDPGFGLPQFVKYIFLFALSAVGIVGLLAIFIAAFGYVMSVGNPQKAAEAKGQLVSALLGLLLLLGSYLLLNLVNPDLLTLGLSIPQELRQVSGGGH